MIKITIAGRPNTGKSTLFNALTGTRDALVHDRPGVTRDTISGVFRDRPYSLYDTAGLERANSGIALDSTNMAIDAVATSDAVLFVENGLISGFGEIRNTPIPEGCDIIDAEGAYVGPGFVDIHVHAGNDLESFAHPKEVMMRSR